MKKLHEFNHAAEVLTSLVMLPEKALKGLSEHEVLATKLDYLTQIIDRVRGFTSTPRGSIASSTRMDFGFADPVENQLVFGLADSSQRVRGPIRTRDIAPWLLVFLHNEEYAGLPVHEILRGFTAWMAAFLHGADYDTTMTGAVRFHTNARFAADRLRRYGLLLTTHHERFHTWRLSLGGILAARELWREMLDGEPWAVWSLHHHPPMELLHSIWHTNPYLIESNVEAMMHHPAVGGVVPHDFREHSRRWIHALRESVSAPIVGRSSPDVRLLRKTFLELASDPAAVRVAHLLAGFEPVQSEQMPSQPTMDKDDIGDMWDRFYDHDKNP